MTEYIAIFEDIDRVLNERFGRLALPFRIIGRSALEMAGLPERGTKDVDALEEFLRVDTLSDEQLAEIEEFLESEFGKKSPGALRHGLYLDLVDKGIAWLPQHPRFIDEKKLTSITVSRLCPVDVCVSKTFAAFKLGAKRGSDRPDIIEAIDAELVDVAEYVSRLDETFPVYETHAEAPEAFPQILKFIEEEILVDYDSAGVKLNYALPSWMENM